MTEKNDNPEFNSDPALPDPAGDTASDQENVESVKDTAPASDQENVADGFAPEESSAAESLETKPAWSKSPPAAKSSFAFTPFLLILVLGAVAGGGFWIHEEQKKLQKEVQAGFNQMASRLDTVEADLQRLQKNQQQLETSRRTFQAHQSEVAETFQAHENSMSTLDEDILRLQEELNRLAQPAVGSDGANSTSTATPDGDITEPDSPARGQPEIEAEEAGAGQVALAEEQTGAMGSNFAESPTIAGVDATPSADPAKGQPAEAALADPERSQEAQEYIDFVESTTAKFFRLVKEGFVNLWQWFASLF